MNQMHRVHNYAVSLSCAALTAAKTSTVIKQHAVSATTYSIAQSLICMRSRFRQ